MKKLFFSAVIIAATAFACQHDNVEQVATSALSHLSADEMRVANSVGSLIPTSDAFLQIAAYQKANPSGTSSVQFNRAALETILGQPHVVGVRGYYIRNTEGKLDLTLVGIDKNLNTLYTANTMFSGNRAISAEKVKEQIVGFQAENPTAVRAVAFGSKLIYDIMNRNGSDGVLFHFVTDKDGNRNLVFTGTNVKLNDTKNASPNARDGDDGAAGNGFPCPQHC